MKAQESGIIQIKVVMADDTLQIQAGLLSISRMKQCLQAICDLIQSIRASGQVDVSVHTLDDDDFLLGT